MAPERLTTNRYRKGRRPYSIKGPQDEVKRARTLDEADKLAYELAREHLGRQIDIYKNGHWFACRFIVPASQ